MGLNKEKIALAEKTAKALREKMGSTKIILFGSVALGRDDEDSDIDLLVIEPGKASDESLSYEQISTLFQIYSGLDKNEFPTFPGAHNFIDLCCISSQHFEKPPLWQLGQVKKIKKHGIEL